MSDQLPPHARALLTALQHEDTPNADEQRRMKQQVFARLGLGAVGAATIASTVASHAAATSTVASQAAASSTVASHAATTSVAGSAVGAGTSSGGFVSLLAAKLGTAKVAVGLTVALATAGGTALWSRTYQEPPAVTDTAPGINTAPITNTAPMMNPPVDTAPTPSHNVVPAVPDPPLPPPASTPEVLVAPQPETVESIPTPRRKGAANQNGLAPRSSLEAEAELLAQAHQKISLGNPQGALTVLREHQKRFPRGTLSLERQATLAVARCLAGETTRGRTEAERFRRTHPNSPMVKRLELACQLSKP